MSILRKVGALAALALVASAHPPVHADDAAAAPPTALSPAWVDSDKPETHQGLVIEPRLIHWRDKLFVFWAGTSETAINPEVFYSSRDKKDTVWNKTKAPFFGQDEGNVRHISVCTARDMMGLLFQRRGNQGDRAVEVCLSGSRDNGFSFGHPNVIDSYVLPQAGGSSVAIAARQGAQRPELTAAWVAEGGDVKAAEVDLRSSFRPVAHVAGKVRDLDADVQVVANGGDGFYVLWPEAGALKSTHVKPLTGNLEDTQDVLSGDFKKNFSTCSNYHGPAYLVASNEGPGQLSAMSRRGGKYDPLGPSIRFPIAGRNIQSHVSVDETNNRLHMVFLDSKNANRIYYMSCKDGKWTNPEMVLDLDPSIPVSGFDVCAMDDTVWMVAAQGQLVFMKKRKI